LDAALVVAAISPVQAVLWWKHDMGSVLGANWEASGELAVVANRMASLNASVHNIA